MKELENVLNESKKWNQKNLLIDLENRVKMFTENVRNFNIKFANNNINNEKEQ